MKNFFFFTLQNSTTSGSQSNVVCVLGKIVFSFNMPTEVQRNIEIKTVSINQAERYVNHFSFFHILLNQLQFLVLEDRVAKEEGRGQGAYQVPKEGGEREDYRDLLENRHHMETN